MSTSTQMDVLAALLDERRRYEGWIAQLDARRGETPAHVVEKVRGDYVARLEKVTEQLRGRAEELDATAASLANRIAELLASETAQRDERAELELRAAVGEFTAEEAHDALARCDETIGALSTERDSLGGELARVQDVLAQIAPPPSPSESETPAAEGESAAAPAGPDGVPNAVDELAFLQSVVESREGAPALGAAPSATAPAGERAAAPQSDYLPPPVLSSSGRAAQPTESDGALGARVPSMSPDTMASFFKDVPTEQVKTLKCQECGTMNYPTEWYCERCGGELAAM